MLPADLEMIRVRGFNPMVVVVRMCAAAPVRQSIISYS